MARVFKRRRTVEVDGKRTVKQSRVWYVQLRDAQGIRRTVKGYGDKQATQQLASDLERQAAREASGLVDRFAEHRKRPLSEHVEDWHAALLAKGNTKKHADMSVSRLRRVFRSCRFAFLSDLSASQVQVCLADYRSRELSVASSNHLLGSTKAFTRWMVCDGRLPESPLAHLTKLNERTDRRHDRRALADDELRRLLDSARNGPTLYGMDGIDRARLYRLAVETGLRAGELRSLTWGSFDLDGDPPTVMVVAAYSKHRRDDVLPLKASTTAMLARWRDETTEWQVDTRSSLRCRRRPPRCSEWTWPTRVSSTGTMPAGWPTSMP